jgi:O-acetyl-ADP-ribose deacetylase (regulator of RNase III)
MRELEVKGKILALKQGDITLEHVDAIVNAANTRLAGGGGVDGAIHRAGGPEIMAACDEIRAKKGGCPTGEAVITTAGRLHAKYVVHTAGPVWSGGKRGEHALLASCYRSSLRLAAANGCRSIAFPSISTGAYGFPVAEASRIALGTIATELEEIILNEVRMVLFSESDLHVYEEALSELEIGKQPDGGDPL